MVAESYTCRSCGEVHAGMPLAYGSDAPIYYESIPEDERRERAILDADLCMIDKQHFFIVGRLEIPIIDEVEMFSWNVWVSLSEASFRRLMSIWTSEGRENEAPFVGWVSTVLPCYPDTMNLKARVHTRPLGMRPYIELEPTDHPLAIEQRTGITVERVREIAECVLHG